MSKSVWMVMVVVSAFTGFLMGYAVPPLVEVGMIGGGGEKIGIKTDLGQELDDYYSNLAKEE